MTQDAQAQDDTQAPSASLIADLNECLWELGENPNFEHNRLADVAVRIAKRLATREVELSALCTVRDTLQAKLKEMEDARDRVRASFGHRNAEGKCQCVYCRGDAEGIFEHAADYELRNLRLKFKLESVEAERDALSARVTALEDEKTKTEKTIRDDPREASSTDDASACSNVLSPEDDRDLRLFLWLNHGHSGGYGDDGELQCGSCAPIWDYRRSSFRAILDHIATMNFKRFAKAQAAKDGEAGSSDADLLNAERKA